MSAEVPNSEFLNAVYGSLPDGHYGWICAFAGNPCESSPWAGRIYRPSARKEVLDTQGNLNCYFSVAVMRVMDDLGIRRRKDAFQRLAVLVADDVELNELRGRPSYFLQTSPGKHQAGVLIDPGDPDATNADLVDKLMRALPGAVGADESGNNICRYARLPQGRNGKPAAAGFRVQMQHWQPGQVLSLADAAAVFGLDLDTVRAAPAPAAPEYRPDPVVRSMEGVTEGSRNDALFKFACSLRARDIDFDEARVLVLHRAAACTPPLVEREALTCLHSAWKHAPGKSEKYIKIEGPASVEHPQRMDWAALPANPPEVPFIIPDWMPDQVVTLLAAHGGTGKSFLSLFIGLCLAVGRHPFTGEPITPVRVVLYSAEDNMAVMQLRLRRYMSMMDIDEAELHGQLDILDATESDNVLFAQIGRDGATPTARFEWLRQHCQAFGARVLIFDNASDAYGADENNRALVRQFLSALRRIAPAVLLLSHVDAHSSMADPREAKGYSGSTAWNNSARSRWFMAREKNDDILLRVPKSNYARAGLEATLRWDDHHKVFAVASVRQGQPKAQDIAPIILSLLSEVIAAGLEISPAVNASNSIHNALKHDSRYPSTIRPTEVGAMAREWVNTGQLVLEEFPRKNRSIGQRLKLPPARLHKVAQG